ncbi:hypothetical protein [Gloeobacter kilaueensis]|uniref:Uncharacterized protein n=1 Tax=Gloeobacter kilaueensis (strain ATCC BAA-2537 / CCAP 1431/1 / ULC 316 / JS1) TaxID=1183438 RepID=U5QMZ3_GLOK1|nr:hypothetical protein [Gloeobacter kilaueensis]AGY60291.1 hypothetical protein GKIL_4045 [Gloeobacter kilaueensis JS1]
MANGPTRPRLVLPKPLLTLGILVLTLIVYFLLPVANDLGRAALALFVSLVVILLVGFLVPAVYRRVDRGSLLVHTSASFFFGLVSALFLTLGNVFPWIFCWLVLCLFWTFLPNPSFHRSLEDNFGDLFS